MVGRHHRLNGHEFEQTPGSSEGQGSLACCSPWDCKESDMTEQLNNVPEDFPLSKISVERHTGRVERKTSPLCPGAFVSEVSRKEMTQYQVHWVSWCVLSGCHSEGFGRSLTLKALQSVFVFGQMFLRSPPLMGSSLSPTEDHPQEKPKWQSLSLIILPFFFRSLSLLLTLFSCFSQKMVSI